MINNKYQTPVPLSKQEKYETKLLATIIALGYAFALGLYLS